MDIFTRPAIAQAYRERLESERDACIDCFEECVFGRQLKLWENGALTRGGLFDQSAGLCPISSEQFREKLSNARRIGQLYFEHCYANIPVFPEKLIPPAISLMPPIKSMQLICQLPPQDPGRVEYLFKEEAPDGNSYFVVRSYLKIEGFPLMPFGKKRDARPEEIPEEKSSIKQS